MTLTYQAVQSGAITQHDWLGFISSQREYVMVPTRIRLALFNYVGHKQPVGDFMMSVFRNDLKEACGRADSENQLALIAIVGICHNHIPGNVWGSPDRVTEWLKK